MTRAIKPHYLLIAALFAACITSMQHGGDIEVIRVAKAQSMRPASSPAAQGGIVAAPTRKAAGYDVRGGPSISVAKCEAVLAQYRSPSAGSCTSWYDQSVAANIDLAFLLAFYVHESSAGTAGAAVASRSVGNLVCSGWAGRCIGRFRAYDSYAQAGQDWYNLIAGPLYVGAGLTTVGAITPRYAPSFENNPDGYAKAVEQMVTKWRASQ